MFRAMPDQIDLEPHEYRTPADRRVLTAAFVVSGFLTVGGLLIGAPGWACAVSGFLAGVFFVLRFPQTFFQP